MDPITTGILANLATDLVKWLAKGPSSPIDSAITKTAEAFPKYVDLSTTLRQWLKSPDVMKVLYAYLRGLGDQESIGLEALTEVFLRDTQFYLPEGGREAAGRIITEFLEQMREEYLITPALGLPRIANRLEEVLSVIRTGFETLHIPLPDVLPQPLLEIDRPKKLTREHINLLLRPHSEWITMPLARLASRYPD